MRYAMPFRHPYRRRSLQIAAVLLVVWCGGAFAISPIHGVKPGRHSDRSTIERMENQWRTAILQGDVAALDRLVADDFLSISSNGTLMDKQEFLRRASTRKRTVTRLDISETKIRMRQDSAIVTSRADVEGKDEEGALRGVFRYTRVYIRLPNSGWKISNFEITRVRDADATGPELHPGVPVQR